MSTCSCVTCRKEFSVKGIHTHFERSHIGKIKFSSGNNGKYEIISNKARDKEIENEKLYMMRPNRCIGCQCDLPYKKRGNKYCSASCVATAENIRRKKIGWKLNEKSKIAIAEKLSGRVYKPPVQMTKNCPTCGKLFTFMHHYIKKDRIYCCRECYPSSPKQIQARENRSALLNYRADCKFKFGLSDYPNEFDFSLIETYGWYKPKNRGDNTRGVSRDHMVSVKYGFENNLPVEHLRHPANCRLLLHSQNISKYTKNSISYNELLVRIKEWDVKYPPNKCVISLTEK